MPGQIITRAFGKTLHRIKRTTGAALLGLAVCATAAEARRTYPIFKPPGNVASADYAKLLGGNVFVSHPVNRAKRIRGAKIYVLYIGSKGRFVSCALKGRSTTEYITFKHSQWKVRLHLKSRRDLAYPELINGRDLSGNKIGVLIPVYDGRTGAMSIYTPQSGRWWNIEDGHLQKRLPRAVWTVCPDFPSAESLGVGINEKQTAVNYHKLVKQDPGQRILRPDLVTPDPTECRDAKTGKFSLCKGRK